MIKIKLTTEETFILIGILQKAIDHIKIEDKGDQIMKNKLTKIAKTLSIQTINNLMNK